jgi:hypothetical protein
MSELPKTCSIGSLRLDVERESALVQHAKMLLTHYRKQMGWEAAGRYRAGSWLWKRHIAERQYENDFNHRDVKGTIFGTTNMSWNIPKSFIDTHYTRVADDLLGSDSFFGTMPEGPEDQHPALKSLERYLQRRGQMVGLQELFKEAAKGAFKRGETIYKAIDKRKVTRQRRDVRVVMTPNDSGGQDVARDSRGDIITELDAWVPVPDNSAKKMLLRDPRVTMQADAEPLLSDKTQQVEVAVDTPTGCDIELPYFADIVVPITAPDLSEFACHIFEMAPDDVIDMLAPAARTNSAEQWLDRKTKGGVLPGERSDQATAILARGELDGLPPEKDSLSFAPVLMGEFWMRCDADGDGKREHIGMLLDLNEDWPIAYDFAGQLMPWTTNKVNPFGVIRINPVLKRWHGIGYYEELADHHTFVDKNYNRIEVEIAKSGNLMFENREATEEGKAGLPLRFRTLQTYKLSGVDRTAEDAVSVVTVSPQTAEITEIMDSTMQRLQTEKGMVTPANAELAGLDAANTAHGMDILKQVSDTQLREREAELMKGYNEALGDFADIEAANFDQAFAERVLRPMNDERQKLAAQGNSEVVDALTELMQWLAENKDNLRNRVKIVLSKKSSTQVVEESKQTMEVIDRWFAYPPQIQAVMKDVFTALLTALGVQNAEALLITTPINPLTSNDPEQQPATGQPATTPASPTPAMGTPA